MHHIPWILFLFALGACVGSFLNVVVWRLPQVEYVEGEGPIASFFRAIEALSQPPSHCPKCKTPLKWYDNLPVIGWIKLRGRCRFCHEPISARYPLVEAVTGLLFVFYYVMFFVLQVGPCAPRPPGVAFTDPFGGAPAFIATPRPLDILDDWAMYGLYMALVAALLAASLIDAEQFIIPAEIPWVLAGLGVLVHAILDTPRTPGALNVNPEVAALAAGGAVGLIVSLWLVKTKRLPVSFAEGEVMQVDRDAHAAEVEAARREGREPTEEAPRDFTRAELRAEMVKEIRFLLPPLTLAAAWWALVKWVGPLGAWWEAVAAYHWVSGGLGAVFGALVGALVVWVTRILGTLGFGKLAMGLGDVHLMFGVGAIIGAGAATVAFFVAPFFGILTALYMLLTGKRRELPYGPYLSMASAAMLLFYCPIAEYLAPGMAGLAWLIQSAFGAGGAAGGA